MRVTGERVVTERVETHEEYEHRQHLTRMLKVIHECPMDEHIKRVMRSRIWGIHPDTFHPLTAYQIQLMNKGRGNCDDCEYDRNGDPIHKCIDCHAGEKRINDLESQGRFYCKQFLLSKKAPEIVESYNKNFRKNNANLFGKKPHKEGGFSV